MPTIHHLPLSKSNAFLLLGERPVLVDSGSPGDLPTLEKELRKAGVRLEQIALLVLTHAHFDHAGNAAAIRKRSNCLVAAHRLEQSCFENGENTTMAPYSLLARLLNPLMHIPFDRTPIDLVVDDAFDLTPYGADAQILFTPGHTPGSISVLTAQGEAIVGDLVGGGLLLGLFLPDRPRYHYWIASMDDVRASLQKLFAHPIAKLYVGHGGPLDGARAREFFLG